MNQTTKNALLQAYINLQKIVEDLYLASDKAIENGEDADASGNRK